MTYSAKEIAAHKATICDRISNGESLRQICDDEGMPAASTVFLWLQDDTTFSEQYARAREAQADAIFDEILLIADDGRNDWMTRKFGDEERWVENGEAMRRSQLRIEARKWMAGKLQPKKYGDKLALEHGGAVQHSIADMTDAQLAAIAASGGGRAPKAAKGKDKSN
jgi:hypothetical protein